MTVHEDKLRCLEEATRLVCGERGEVYGTPYDNFSRIAALWEPLLAVSVTPRQVALCMIAVKMARLVNSESHEDSWIDMAGYAACGMACKMAD